MKILFLAPYPLRESPSQRFRFEHFFDTLKEAGHDIEFQSFLNSQNWRIFYQTGNVGAKAWALLAGFGKRLSVLSRLKKFDFIFVHREITPLGPPVFEWLIAKVFRKKIIYDFDDAIWMTDRQDESFFLKAVKWRSKVGSICRWAYKNSCGNDYLKAFAASRNVNSHVIPTVVNTAKHLRSDILQPLRTSNTINLGWTGSHSTLKYLTEIELVLQQLETEFEHISVVIIADKKPNLNLKKIQFIPWRASTEIEDLMQIDIGLMPLPDDEWSKGKCGFKIIQYLSLEIPAIASPVGVNPFLVKNGTTGYLCSTENEWLEVLRKLIKENETRRALGKHGRDLIEEKYSVAATAPLFLRLFT